MLIDVAARNASLDNDYGTTRGPNAAASHQVALYDEDGVELSSAGYARVTLPAASWPAAVDGQKSATVVFPAPTGEWLPAVSWRLIAGGVTWDGGDFYDPLYVTAASGTGPSVTVTVYYSTAEVPT